MPCKCAICGYEKAVTEDFFKWSDIPGLTTEFYPVTKGGKPTGEVLNFICARCLQHANIMRVFVKTMMSGVQVTDHAVSRFIERTGADISDKQTAKIALIRAFSKARKIRFRSNYMVSRIINSVPSVSLLENPFMGRIFSIPNQFERIYALMAMLALKFQGIHWDGFLNNAAEFF